MTSRFSRLSVLACITALTAGLLVTASASQAASGGITVTTTKVAQFGGTDRRTAIPVKCNGSATCYGVARWYNSSDTLISAPLYYSVPKGGSAFIWTKLNSIVPTGSYRLSLAEIGPVGRTTNKTMTIEPRQYSAPLAGTISGPAGGGVTEMKINRWYYKSGRLTKINSVDIGTWGGGNVPYSFGNVPLGTNNVAATDYRLSISAKVNGVRYEWFWRGSGAAGTTYTATKTPHHASPVRVTTGGYAVNFTFGTVSGTVTGPGASTAKIRVIGTPAVMPTTTTGRKDLDEAFCGDEYGTDTGGSYSIAFVPRSNGSSADPRYIVGVIPDDSLAVPAWNQSRGTFGSCLAARNYSDSSTSGLVGFAPGDNTLALGNTTLNTGLTISGDVTFSGFSNRFTDRKMDVREYVPGVSILSLPIVKNFSSQTNGSYTLNELPPGRYWVSAGRQESCSLWYPSHYTNNLTYLSADADRETEIWKSFSKLSYLSGSYHSPPPGELPTVDGYEGIAYDHGARYQDNGGLYYGYEAQNRIPSGYAGWMYRDVCVTEGAGAYRFLDTTNEPNLLNVNLLDKKGATISGTVRRYEGKTYKEMMVSAYSTQGRLVARGAYSSSTGSFVIRGLETGNYNIVLNTDSWRGLGRTFTGVHTKYVTRGGSYSVGTLTAKF